MVTRTTAPTARNSRKPGQDGQVKRARALQREIEGWRLRDKLFNDLFGGVVPPGLDLSRVDGALDLGSNAGGWLRDLAQLYPKMSCFGVEPRIELVREARRLGEEMQLENVTFIQQYAEYVKGKVFRPRFFDLVHLRCGVERDGPAPCLALCRAVLVEMCRPGGYIVWEESELPISNCISLGQVCETLIEILQNENMWVVGDAQLGITLYMESELRKCGCEIVSDESRTLDLSWGKPGHALLKHMMWRLKRGAPTLLRWDRDMPDEHLRQRECIFWKNFNRACDGIDSQDFRGACSMRQVVSQSRTG
jgi:SAM-dependent methyltransferase